MKMIYKIARYYKGKEPNGISFAATQSKVDDEVFMVVLEMSINEIIGERKEEFERVKKEVLDCLNSGNSLSIGKLQF
ncbi:MAG: hypothetical protein M9892_03365 [Bacteroidetes bacterium]|nr:hypothetical protein [Bacteroidota bacterium]